MGILSVEKLDPGMVLESDVKSITNQFLLSKGTTLTSKEIRLMKMWGVIEARVSESKSESNSKERADPKRIEKAKDYQTPRFLHANIEQTAIIELFRISVLHKAEAAETGRDDHFSFTPSFSSKKTCQPKDLGKIDFKKLIQNETQLTSLPGVFYRINETIRKPNSSANDIAEVIRGDTNLTARLLKIANSALYSFPIRINSISRVVAILGTKQLIDLCYAVHIIDTFSGIPSFIMDMKSFWSHSIACGICSRIIGGYLNIRNTEQLFLGGLLHDIGRLVFFNYTPSHAMTVFMTARNDNQLLSLTEKELLNCDHASVGGLLLQKWNLPSGLKDIVMNHHLSASAKNTLETSIVHCADVIVNTLEIGSSGERFVPPMDPKAWKMTGLSINHLNLITKQTLRQFDETYRLFFKSGI